MTDLETRIAALEKGGAFNATQEAIRKREEEFLTTLRDMKARIQQEQEEANKSGGSTSSEELGKLREENAKLKAKLIKNNYRIHHLVTGMEELLTAKKN
mmetsp:Transcript_4389/g.11324  ORF Transcript_4389/g.11324 Transcript_4389/m.11324 type:complete len:99 (-) Transcript_4389:209-505(-)|eukprot:CAMPEP_0197183642 /NCGR_PEP_ID=MMETSP1423-20130617/7931_1 /TAXON_ID=476441 /ORGANISM="Pseudo-nitzschia heimii, Strain UNC1101" /LENGTH=98 /DNA_ID=CAMNT_0042634241 /DNA_START=18 /DNA_END=314 /DNA_ORIENTATION=-